MNGFNRFSGQFALPYHQNPPAKIFEFSYNSTVSFNVFSEFPLPEIDIALGRTSVFTSWMPVPIASVNEHGRMEFGKARSGLPGRWLFLRRYLNPSLCSPHRRIHSGFVSRLRTFDITLDRCFLVRMSVISFLASELILSKRRKPPSVIMSKHKINKPSSDGTVNTVGDFMVVQKRNAKKLVTQTEDV